MSSEWASDGWLEHFHPDWNLGGLAKRPRSVILGFPDDEPEPTMGWTRGRSYHQDLRERVFQVADAGTSVTGVAKVLQVSISYVSKVLGRRRTGETTARPQRGHVPAKLAAYHTAIREALVQIA